MRGGGIAVPSATVTIEDAVAEIVNAPPRMSARRILLGLREPASGLTYQGNGCPSGELAGAA